MIISANRLSSINGRVHIGINENYGSEDLGRILMEDAMNDMAIFNGALMQDMQEIRVRQEGTMLESEIQSLNENAVKDFCKKIVDKLKKFWAKMKAWFKTAIANISAYIVRDGNTFIKMHLADIGRLDKADKCGKRSKRKYPIDFSYDKVSTSYKSYIGDSASDIANKMFKDILPDFDSSKSFYECAKAHFFEDAKECTIGDLHGTSVLIDTLKRGKDQLSAMKKLKDGGEKKIVSTIKDAETKAKDQQTDKEDKKKAEEVKTLGDMATAVTKVVSTVSKAGVKLVRFDLAEARKALATAIGTSARTKAKNEATLLESLLLEADEEIEALGDNDYASDLTPEEEEAVEALVDAIEEKIEDADTGDTGSDDE